MLRVLVGAFAFCAAAISASASTQNLSEVPPRLKNELRIHFLNVGAGTCTVVECPDDAPPLIVDCGSKSQEKTDLSEEAAAEYVRALLTRNPQSPNIVLSHADVDHYNYIPGMLAGIRPQHIWLGGDLADYRSAAFPAWIRTQEEAGVDIHNAFEPNFSNHGQPIGKPHLWCGSTDTYILTVNSGTSKNSQSLVLMARYGDFSAVLTGDAEGETEARALQNVGGTLKATLLSLSHHGADTRSSNSDAWAAAVEPAVLISSAGPQFFHPRCTAVGRFQNVATTRSHDVRCGEPGNFSAFRTQDAFFVTSVSGTIVATTSGTSVLRLACSRSDECNTSITLDPLPGTSQVSPGQAPLSVRITELVPNPTGDDKLMESVTLQNTGTQSVSLDNWALRDRWGLKWTLGGILVAGESRTILRSGQPMDLDDGGDEIRLQDNSNRLVHRVSYGQTTEGATVQVALGRSAIDRIDRRTVICGVVVAVLCLSVFCMLVWLEGRERQIRQNAAAVVLRKETFGRIDRALIQTLINSAAHAYPTFNTPVVDEVIDEALARILRGGRRDWYYRRGLLLRLLARRSSLAKRSTDLGARWWNRDQDVVIDTLRRLKSGTLKPTGLKLSLIFALSALVVGTVVFALIIIPGTFSVADSLLDEVLTTLTVLVVSGFTTVSVALKRRLGLLVPPNETPPVAPLNAGTPEGRTRRAGAGFNRGGRIGDGAKPGPEAEEGPGPSEHSDANGGQGLPDE